MFKNDEIKTALDFKTAMDKFMRDHNLSLYDLAKEARENDKIVELIYMCRHEPTERLVHAMGMLVKINKCYVDDPAKKFRLTDEQRAENHRRWKESFKDD